MSNLYFLNRSFPNEYFKQTANYIASVQEPDGSIPWFKGGHTDPWDHVESAMGLSICGMFQEAENAYDWLRDTQQEDGSWWNAYKDGRVIDITRKESNFVAYVATGVWHHLLITKNVTFLKRLWPVVEAAIEFVLLLQTEYGEISWAVDTDKGTRDDALITGCSSIYKSLECAINLSVVMNRKRPHWVDARERLGHALRNHPERFDRTWESKSRYSMDWFYPVMTGVLSGPAALSRINAKWDVFVVENLGCRCVSNEPWVTIAESCELTMALLAVGDYRRAARLYSWLHNFREKDGSYWTGYVYKKDERWPDEKPTWTAGAVILAGDALAGATPAAQLFTRTTLMDSPETIKNVSNA